jgi:lambda repressor-like predicted transcriptional regulator
MKYPQGFPAHAQAAVIAEQVRASQAFIADLSRQMPPPPPGVVGQEAWTTMYARKYILRVFSAFAHQACELGRYENWTATQVDDACREFLRLLAIDVRVEFGHLPIRRMVSDMGYLTIEAWNEFTASAAWKEYQEELLGVADLQAQSAAQGKLGTMPKEAIPATADTSQKRSIEHLSATRKAFVVPLLKKKGMTRSKLATEAGIDPSVVYDYLSGKSTPRPDNRNVIAEVLGVAESELPD